MAIGALTLLHLVETLMWAVPLHLLGIVPNLRDSYYYVLESYTTLGEGNVSLPPDWRLIGPMIAMSGLFTFGWTGSVLVSIMTDFAKFDRSRASDDARDRESATLTGDQRQRRPAFGDPPQGPSTTFCSASSARAVWLPARARSTRTRPSSASSVAAARGHHVAHVDEAVGLLGELGGVVAHLPEPDVVADGAVAPQPALEEGAGDQALVGEGADHVARGAPVHGLGDADGQQVDVDAGADEAGEGDARGRPRACR